MNGSTMRFVPPPRSGVPGYYFHCPAGRSPAEIAALPVVVLVHGISRNAVEHVARASRTPGLAERILIAPLFEPALFGRYQQLDRVEGSERCDLALIALLDDLQSRGVNTARVTMFGFSGGAQFAHRFALFHAERLAALSLVAAGWYTMPDSDAAWPMGVDTSGTEFPDARPSALLDLPIQLMVGRGDRLRGKSVRTSAELDAAQGRHRLARAQRFFAALRAMADAAGLPARVRLDLLAADRHAFGSYADRGQMLRTFANWLEDEALVPQPVLESTL